MGSRDPDERSQRVPHDHRWRPDSDLIYDSGTARLFATGPTDAPQFANSLVRINPMNGEIEASFLIGLNPGKLARSWDGRFVYVALDGESAIRQFDLTTQTPGIRFDIGANSAARQFTASDIVVLPNKPNSIAVAILDNSAGNFTADIAIFDSGVRRPASTGSGPWIEVSPDGQTLYGQQAPFQTTFDRMRIGPEGVSLIDSTPDVFGGGEFNLANGLIYAASGEVVAPASLQREGIFPGVGAAYEVLPELANGRVLFLAPSPGTIYWYLRAYDLTTRREIGSLDLYRAFEGDATSLVRCDGDRLAFRTTAGEVLILRTTLLPTTPATDLSMELTASPEPAISGQDIEFRLTVRNAGTNAAERVTVELPLPSGLFFRSAESSQATMVHSFGMIRVTASQILAGATTEARIVVGTDPNGAGLVVAAARMRSAAVESSSIDNFADLPLSVGRLTGRNGTTRAALPNADFVYDPSRRVFYASVPVSLAGNIVGGTVAVLDPATAVVRPLIPVATEPGRLACSRDGQFLYVADNASNRLVRLNLSTRTVDRIISLPAGGAVLDMQVSPVDPNQLAIVQDDQPFVLSATNLIPLNAVVSQHTRPLTFSDDGAWLYVFGSVSGTLSASVFDIRQNPPASVFHAETLGNGWFSPVISAGGRLYSGVGRVYLPESLAIEHTFLVQGVWNYVAPEPELNRVYYLHGTRPPRLTTFDLATQQQIDSAVVGGFVGLAAHDSFSRWGADGLAFRTPTDVYLLRRNTVAIMPGQDSDVDGLPDEWKISYDLNPNWPADAAFDTDNDGATNLREFEVGSDPGSPDAFLQLTWDEPQTGSLRLRWNTGIGFQYQIEKSDELVLNEWTPIYDVVTGTGQVTEISLPSPANPHQFFRIRLVP